MVPVALNVRVKCGVAAAAAAESCDRVERVMIMAESRKLCGELEGGSEIGLLRKRRQRHVRRFLRAFGRALISSTQLCTS